MPCQRSFLGRNLLAATAIAALGSATLPSWAASQSAPGVRDVDHDDNIAETLAPPLVDVSNASPQSALHVGPGESETDFTLGNGVRVRFLPAVDCGWVGVIASYDVGFIDDPRGRPQLAHLAEHLRVTGASGGQEANVRLAHLNRIGSANAETQPHFTYYDYLVPSGELELALRTEAQRLGELHLTQADIEREGPRAAGEASGLAVASPQHLHKFALMAAVQAWRWNETHSNIVTGLGKTPLNIAVDFIDQHYRPDTLTVYIAGDFDQTRTRAMLDATLGLVEEADEPYVARVEDWSGASRDLRMTWDLPATVAMASATPPTNVRHRAIVATSLMVRLHMERLKIAVVDLPLGTSRLWPAGVLPLFVAGTTKPEVDPLEAIAALSRLLVFEAEDVTTAHLAMARQLSILPAQSLAPERVSADARRLAKMRGISESRAIGMVVLQAALNEAQRASMNSLSEPADGEEWLRTLVKFGQTSESGTVVISPRILSENQARQEPRE